MVFHISQTPNNILEYPASREEIILAQEESYTGNHTYSAFKHIINLFGGEMD
jgi:hypothetical protein